MTTSHVPKFGDWDKHDNMPYTLMFDNAHAGKNTKFMNPNDPEENPDLAAALAAGVYSRGAHHDATPMARAHNERWKTQEESEMRKRMEGNPHHSAVQSTGDILQQNHDHTLSGLAAHQGIVQPSVGSLGQEMHKPMGDDRAAGAYSGRHRSARKRLQEPLEKGRVVPKFGEWDPLDPTAGDGYTVIFNNYSNEKRTGGTVPIRQQAHSPNQHKESDLFKPQNMGRQKSQKLCIWCFSEPAVK